MVPRHANVSIYIPVFHTIDSPRRNATFFEWEDRECFRQGLLAFVLFRGWFLDGGTSGST